MQLPPPSYSTLASGRRMDLDIIRGFALFGILMVNIQYFAMPFTWVADPGWAADQSSLSSFLRSFVAVFFEGKFITLFSFLFGLGCALFAQRVRDAGELAGPKLFRRMLALIGIGTVHAVFFWSGDVLLIYGVLGLLLLLFLNRRPKTLWIWTILFSLGQWLVFLALIVLVQTMANAPDLHEDLLLSMEAEYMAYDQLGEDARAAYAEGDWKAMTEVRLRELGFYYESMLWYGGGFGYLMALFLLGLLAGRNGWFANTGHISHRLTKHLRWMLPVGLGGSLLNLVLLQEIDMGIPSYSLALYSLVFILSTPLLTASYVIFLLRLRQHTKNHPFWPRLAASGRISLTFYLAQTLLFTTVFYSYGFGLFGQVSYPQIFWIGIVGYALLLLAAKPYLQKFQTGPFEWLWRLCTYGRMRKEDVLLNR